MNRKKGADMDQPDASDRRPARTGQAHALAFLLTVIISTSFPLGEHITHGLDPAVLMCIRFVLAVLLMAPIVAWRLSLPPARSFLSYFALGALLALFFWCMFEALRYTAHLTQARSRSCPASPRSARCWSGAARSPSPGGA